MGVELIFIGPRSISFREYNEKTINPKEVKVKTIYSGISHGTEMNVYRGIAPFFNKTWDPSLRLFKIGKASWEYPITYGYEEVGRVIEVGNEVTGIKEGDIVALGYGHRTTAILNSDIAKANVLPSGVEPIEGIFMGIAPTALNIILDASIRVGEAVAIFGQGVVGLITMQLAKLNGADPVIAVDLIDKRLNLSKKLGADIILNPQKCKDVAQTIRELTDGKGVDIAIEVSGSYKALHEAIRSCAYSSKVVAAGFYPLAGKDLFLGEEFHHNRITIVGSQIAGINPELKHRWDHSRLRKTIINMIQKRKINLKELISHQIPFEEAANAFELIDHHPEEVIQVVLTFNNSK
jgi:2-desacetyl-2-hydroxyethyl bacteriochlorophyllide A dehydrogenase